MTVTIGWWALPAFVTVASIYFALRESPEPRGKDYGAGAVIGALFLAGALIVSLVAWLIWALIA